MKRAVLWGSGLILLPLLLAAGTFLHAPLWVGDQVVRFRLWHQHVSSNYVAVDGYRVHYFEARAPGGGGKPLVLVHGLESRGEDWSGMIPTLAAQGFHVYAPDLLGYGRTSKPGTDLSIAAQETLVLDTLHALEVKNVDLCGWSMGGWVVLRLAADHPDLVKRVVLLDAAGVFFQPTWDATLFEPTDAAGVDRLSGMLTPQGKPMPEFIAADAVRKLRRDRSVIEQSLNSMRGGKDLMDFRLGEIIEPTLIVWGREDRLIPLDSGLRMHRGIVDSTLVVLRGCGHLAPQDCAQPVLTTVLNFLKAEPAPARSEREIDGRQP